MTEKTTYIAFDGTEFDSEAMCATYEIVERKFSSDQQIKLLERKPADIPFAMCGVGGIFYLCKSEKEKQILLQFIRDNYYDTAQWIDDSDLTIGWNLIVEDANDPTVCSVYTIKQCISELTAALESVMGVM